MFSWEQIQRYTEMMQKWDNQKNLTLSYHWKSMRSRLEVKYVAFFSTIIRLLFLGIYKWYFQRKESVVFSKHFTHHVRKSDI